MKIGAENKKSVYALVVFGVLAAYMVYSQLLSGPSYPTNHPQVRTDTGAQAPTGPDISQAKDPVARPTSHSKSGEFRPVYVPKKKEDRKDVSAIDPTIRLDLLEKVMKAPPAGGERDLFQISKTPPVKTELAKNEPKVIPFIPYGPNKPAPPPVHTDPPPPPPTPCPLRYYGYSAIHPDGKRTAYFLDGDEVLEANEGAVLKNRWKIVQIGLTKVLVEDTQEKRQQPLNIEPEVTG